MNVVRDLTVDTDRMVYGTTRGIVDLVFLEDPGTAEQVEIKICGCLELGSRFQLLTAFSFHPLKKLVSNSNNGHIYEEGSSRYVGRTGRWAVNTGC